MIPPSAHQDILRQVATTDVTMKRFQQAPPRVTNRLAVGGNFSGSFTLAQFADDEDVPIASPDGEGEQ